MRRTRQCQVWVCSTPLGWRSTTGTTTDGQARDPCRCYAYASTTLSRPGSTRPRSGANRPILKEERLTRLNTVALPRPPQSRLPLSVQPPSALGSGRDCPEPGWHRTQRNDALPGLAETAETRTSAVAGMATTAVHGALIGDTSSGELWFLGRFGRSVIFRPWSHRIAVYWRARAPLS